MPSWSHCAPTEQQGGATLNNALMNCRPVWLPAYVLEWAGGEYADVLLGEAPQQCRGARAQAHVHGSLQTHHCICLLRRRPGLLLCSGDQRAHGGPAISAARQNGAARVVRCCCASKLPYRPQRGAAEWTAAVLHMAFLRHSWMDCAALALLRNRMHRKRRSLGFAGC